MAKKQTLVERFGTLPAGMSKADVEVVSRFLYGAFDRLMARQVRILHPYLETGEDENLPELTVFDFCPVGCMKLRRNHCIVACHTRNEGT